MELLSYLHFQMKLEGIGIVDNCFIRQIDLVPDEKLPFRLLAQFANGELVVYYDEAMAPGFEEMPITQNQMEKQTHPELIGVCL
jgi:hypothetical protein